MSESRQETFTATVQKEGQFTFVAIPFAPREAWGSQPRFRVEGDINGTAVRGTLGALGTDYFLRLSAAWLRASGVSPGDDVTVRLSLVRPAEDGAA